MGAHQLCSDWKKDIGKNTSNNILETENLEEEVPNSNIYEMQSQNEINSVEIDSSLNSKKINSFAKSEECKKIFEE